MRSFRTAMAAIVAAVAARGTSQAEPLAGHGVRVHAPPLGAVVVRARDAWSRRYADDLARQARGPVDFAGRYVLATIGCGAECLSIAAVERRSGDVVRLLPTVCCWPDGVTRPLRHRADSRLLVVYGRLDETGGSGPHRFVLSHGRFDRLPDVRRTARRPGG